jgi:hypothetical protein
LQPQSKPFFNVISAGGQSVMHRKNDADAKVRTGALAPGGPLFRMNANEAAAPMSIRAAAAKLFLATLMLAAVPGLLLLLAGLLLPAAALLLAGLLLAAALLLLARLLVGILLVGILAHHDTPKEVDPCPLQSTPHASESFGRGTAI